MNLHLNTENPDNDPHIYFINFLLMCASLSLPGWLRYATIHVRKNGSI